MRCRISYHREFNARLTGMLGSVRRRPYVAVAASFRINAIIRFSIGLAFDREEQARHFCPGSGQVLAGR